MIYRRRLLTLVLTSHHSVIIRRCIMVYRVRTIGTHTAWAGTRTKITLYGLPIYLTVLISIPQPPVDVICILIPITRPDRVVLVHLRTIKRCTIESKNTSSIRRRIEKLSCRKMTNHSKTTGTNNFGDISVRFYVVTYLGLEAEYFVNGSQSCHISKFPFPSYIPPLFHFSSKEFPKDFLMASFTKL